MNVFDASALLAFLHGEPGEAVVEEALVAGGGCSAANWSETAQQVRARGGDWASASDLLLGYPIAVEPVTFADAEWAASRWLAGEGLSLGDRLCLALGHRLGAEVWTADRRWGDTAPVRQIR